MAQGRVMIVDDNKEFLEELNETLTLSGYEMIAVDDANKALDLALSTKPDVILLDLKMPGKNGFQLATELRQSPDFFNKPIIAMSGFFKDEYVSLLNMCGIKRCLKKPFSPLDIIAQIEEALGEDK